MKNKRNNNIIAMAKWVNYLKRPLPLLCEISEALHLAQLSLMAGRLADKIQMNFEFSKIVS